MAFVSARVVDVLFQVAFWLALAISTYLALTPSPPDLPVLRLSDVQLHAGAFTVLALALMLAYPGCRPWVAGLWLLAYGTGIELVQSLIVERSAELKDLIVDVLGISLGLWLARLVCAPLRALTLRLLTTAD